MDIEEELKTNVAMGEGIREHLRHTIMPIDRHSQFGKLCKNKYEMFENKNFRAFQLRQN